MWSIKYNVYMHPSINTDSNYVYYDCSGTTVGDRGSIACISAYIAVPNLLSMISTRKSPVLPAGRKFYKITVKKFFAEENLSTFNFYFK
jgi:hypothetical protein